MFKFEVWFICNIVPIIYYLKKIQRGRAIHAKNTALFSSKYYGRFL